jgi:hypothetical protein
VPIEPKQPQVRPPMDFDPIYIAQFIKSINEGKTTLRREVGDFVNLFWPNLAHWSCMLWDPKGFPTMLYEMNKYESFPPEDRSKSHYQCIRGKRELPSRRFLLYNH